MPTTTVSPSTFAHSWDFEYLKSSTTTVIMEGEEQEKTLKTETISCYMNTCSDPMKKKSAVTWMHVLSIKCREISCCMNALFDTIGSNFQGQSGDQTCDCHTPLRLNSFVCTRSFSSQAEVLQIPRGSGTSNAIYYNGSEIPHPKWAIGNRKKGRWTRSGLNLEVGKDPMETVTMAIIQGLRNNNFPPWSGRT